MKCIRIILRQAQANYRKEETYTNKMTYPLPPASTVIGALHVACGYTYYHPMDIAIQGKYGAMIKKPYQDHAFLNSTMNDRGTLVKMQNKEMLSKAYTVVAESLGQNSNFDKEEKISVKSRELLDEYKWLRTERNRLDIIKKESIKPKEKEYKDIIKKLKTELKALDKKSEMYSAKEAEINNVTDEMNQFLNKFAKEQAKIDDEYGKYASLQTSIKYYELLCDVELMIHVRAEDNVIADIMEHIYDMRSIGRSEDFVDVIDIQEVELFNSIDKKILSADSGNHYAAYINLEHIKTEDVLIHQDDKTSCAGTLYLLNINYEIEKNKRKFHKGWVKYVSSYIVDEQSKMGDNNLFVDADNNIVSFIKENTCW